MSSRRTRWFVNLTSCFFQTFLSHKIIITFLHVPSRRMRVERRGEGGDRVWKILVQIRVHIFKVFICCCVLIAPYCWREFHSETFADCLLFIWLYVWEVGRRWWYSDWTSGWTIWISNPGKARYFSLPQNVDTSTGVHSAHLLKRYLDSFPGGKRRGRKFDRSLPCSFEVRNEWSRTSKSLYAFMSWTRTTLHLF